MTNPRAELVEKVARALYETPVWGAVNYPPWEEADEDNQQHYLAEASAAIDIVLEEAARVADRNAAEAWAEGAEETRGLMRMQAADIAAAIRAMNLKQQEPIQ